MVLIDFKGLDATVAGFDKGDVLLWEACEYIDTGVNPAEIASAVVRVHFFRPLFVERFHL